MQSLGQPGAEPDLEPGSHRKAFKRLLPYLWPAGEGKLKARVVISLVFLAAAKAIGVYTPFFYRDAINALSPEGDTVVLLPLAALIAYGAARLMALVFGQLRDAVFIRVSQHGLRRIALETFTHLHALSLRFHLERRMGGLTRAIERGTNGIELLLRVTLFSILPTFLELGLVAGIFYVNFGSDYTVVLVGAIVIYVGFTFYVTDWRTKFRRTMNKEDRDANTKAVDSLLNFETVKYFGNEAHEAARYDSALEGYQRAAVKSQFSLGFLNVGQAVIINVILVLVMAMSARDMIAGTITIGDVVLVNTLMIQLFIPLNFLGFVFREVKQGLVDLEFMLNILDTDPEIHDKHGAPPLALRGGSVRFDHVSFGYDERRPILKDVSFEVPAGKTVAIVGPSGAGKSTISRILFRFYEITDGQVLIDGQDIRDITLKSLRAAIGMVPQDTVLFNDSIRYNILYGDPGADDAAMRQACRLAQIEKFIESLPDGYETNVGERGLKLSGGEKQRVAIARTILKGPEILLLDEATSALDTETEKDIQASIAEVSANRTTLIIAHRLSTIVHADEILVLDEGEIVERGAHYDLLERPDGLYARMWARQLEAAEVTARLEDLKKDRYVREALEPVDL